MKLLIKPLNDCAKEKYLNHGHFHEGDAGLDWYVLDNINFKPGETKLIKFGISCQPEDGKAYYLIPRSSIGKTALRMSNSIGLIDGGYRGEIMAMCDNIKTYEYEVNRGDRLFQLVSYNNSSIEFNIVDELSDTTRGKGGFGSTGK